MHARLFAPLLVILSVLSATGTPARETHRISGTVRDVSGSAVTDASVSLVNAQQAILRTTRTNSTGGFSFEGVLSGSYMLLATSPGFAERRIAVNTSQSDVDNLGVNLAPSPLHSEVTVSAEPGVVQDPSATPQPVNVVNISDISQRAKAVVAQAASEEPGVQLQRTSSSIAGVFVRGLTGNKVSVFVDGVRYSTSAMRGGINSFLDLIEPSNLEAVEILRGPNSAQYGSDALGGSVQFVSRAPSFAASGPALRTTVSTFANSADASFGSNISATYGKSKFGLFGNITGRRINNLRPGGGVDSHSAFQRFFGLPSNIFLGERLPDTGFTQYGGVLRMNWSPAPRSQFIAHYSRSQQDGGKRFDQLLGGDGNLVADLRNLMLDFFYVRFDQQQLGWFDQASMTYSFNSQREERVNQGGSGNPGAAINHEYERTRAYGLQGWLAKQWDAQQNLLFGADYYHEGLRAPSFAFNPVNQTVTLRRPRVPDHARYLGAGIYVQDIFEAIPHRLRLVGNLRYSSTSYRARAADSPTVGGRPLWADDSLRTDAVTFRGGIVVTPATGLSFSGNLSSGFRAPHMTDLGTLGLTGSGFEVAAPEVAGLGATVGDSAGLDAISTGLAVEQLRPEVSLTYEAGARYRHRVINTEFSFFVNDITESINKQALVLPPGAVSRTLGGTPITAQNPNGVVFVAASPSPVLVRANFGDARIFGFEHTLELRIRSAWSVGTAFTYLHARDTRTDLPPNIEGGTPPPDGYLKIRYAPGGKRFWIEPYIHAAGRQDRLSTLDLEDRRIGAMRSRASIRNFFINGATARDLVGAGGSLLATGENLAQIQNRVLGPGVAAAPLFQAVPGYVTLNLRGGLRLGERNEVFVDFENLGDRNYRGISWGLDAPGRSAFFRFTTHF